MLMTPLGEGLVSGENAPATGSEAPDTLYPDVDSRGGASAGGGRWKPLLDLISSVESPGNQYNAIAPGDHNPRLSQMTIAEANKAVGVKGGKGAIGRYQLTNPIGQAAAAGLKPTDLFSPENQDKIAIKLIEGRGGNQWLSGKITDRQFAQALSAEWRGLPYDERNQTYPDKYARRNKAHTTFDVFISTLGKVKKGSATPSTNINVTGMPTPGVTTSVKDEFKGKSGSPAGTITSERGMRLSPTSGKYKMHHGIDIAPAGPGYYVALKLSGKVNLVSWDPGGYGNYVDIKSGNTIYRFAHLAKVMVKQNQSYNGQTIGEIGTTGGSTGIHLHFEVRPGGGNSINPRPYLGLLSIGKQLIGIAGKPETVQVPQLANAPTPSAQVSRSGQQSQAQRLASATSAPERKGEQIYLVNSGTTQQPMMMGSNQPSDVGMQMSEFDLVNRFMKNKLLLDLAYL
jgi:murein DD-endopeptidase MepM/ murein hydrolase activator NlpD